MNLAKAHQAAGQYRRAAVELETALSAAEHASDSERAIPIKNALGAVLTLMRRFDRAEALLVESLVEAEERQDAAVRASILNDLGNLYAAQGRYAEAQAMYRKGLAASQEAGNRLEAARVMANAAISAAAEGQFAEAEKHNTQAAALLSRTVGQPGRVEILLTVGLTDQRLLAELPKSRERLLRRAFESYHEGLRIARRREDRRAESYALGYLGGLYELESRPDEALRLARRAAFLAQQVQAPDLLYRWQWQTGRLLVTMGDLEAAVRSLQQAVSSLESIRGEVAGGLGNRALMMDFREAVGGVYYDLADARLRLADRLEDPAQAREHVLAARQAVDMFKAGELVDYFRDRCIAMVRSDVRKVEEVAADTAVLYIIPLRDRTELIVSYQGGMDRVKVPVGSEQLVAEVHEFRRRLEDRTSHRYRISAQRLYDWLVKPLEATLTKNGITTLVFVPDGALRTVPMAALHDGERFLAERYAVAVTPGLMLVAPRPFDPDWGRLLMCGISEPVGGFSALLFVESELDRIEELSGGRRLMDDAFQLSRLEQEMTAQPPDVLHIASHAQFSADPSRTFILTHGGRLTLDELEMLIRPSEFRGTPVELLVLSACETAAGDDRAALGLAGVALKAGARSAMATLWFVNDEASAQLVSGVYANLREDSDCTKAEALRRAQCTVMGDRRYRHPCYWASYLIIGNWL